MTDRIVKITLAARIAEFKRDMGEAADSVRAVGSQEQRIAQTREAMNQLGTAGLVAGGAIVAGLGVAIAKYAEFDQAMSYVSATGEDARKNQEALRQAALDAGAATVYSATESANAIEDLAKAGISAKDILGGALKGSLDLAAAGGMGVADAAGVAATTLQQFRLEGKDASHVADLLAAGAGKAMGDVSDLGMALNQAGLVANQFHLSVEESVGTLAAFANAGMLGSDAGTSMRTMLLRLANPTTEVKKLMAELNIQAYDAQGNFVGLANLAGQLQNQLGGMTQAQRDQTLAMIFGQDAIRGANILLREGKAGIEGWTKAVDDQGYAARVASTRLDNLKGDIEQLSGATDTALITMGSAADGPARLVVQTLTQIVNAASAMPVPMQQGAFWVAALGGAAALTSGIFFLSVPKVQAYTEAIEQMGTGTQRVAGILGAVGKGAGIVAGVGTALLVAVNALIAYGNEIRHTDDAVAAALTTNQSFIESMRGLRVSTTSSAESVRRALDNIRAGNILGQAGNEIAELQDTLTMLGPELAKLPIDTAVAKFRSWGKEMGLNSDQMRTMLDKIEPLRDAIRKHLIDSGQAADAEAIFAYAMKESGAQTGENAKALAALSGKAKDARSDVSDLADAIRGFGSAQLDVREASREFEQAIDDLEESLKKNGNSLDRGTEKGRANEKALDTLAKSTLNLASATLVQTGRQEEAAAVIEKGREKLIEMLAQFGITGQAASDYADQLGLIPSNIPTAVTLNTSEAIAAFDALMEEIRTRAHVFIRPTIGTPSTGGLQLSPNADGGLYDYQRMQAFADGGFPTGVYAARAAGIHKFAEPETIWEAYISGKPDARQRNIGVWADAGRRLGALDGLAEKINARGGDTFSLTMPVVPERGEPISVQAVRAVRRLALMRQK